MQIHSTLCEVRKFLALPVTTTLAQIKRIVGVKSWQSFTDTKKAILASADSTPAMQPRVVEATPFVGKSLSLSLSWNGTEAEASGATFDIYVDAEMITSINAFIDDGHEQQVVAWPSAPDGEEGQPIAQGIYCIKAIWRKGTQQSEDSPFNLFTLMIS